jgi:hypothetical protein
MRFRPFVVGTLTALTLSLVVPVTAKANPSCPPPGVPPKSPVASTPFVDPSVDAKFQSGLLGPNPLPSPSGVVGKLLLGYQRWGTLETLTTKDFVNKFWSDTLPTGPGWVYPTFPGFDGQGHPGKLVQGNIYDRFGNPTGQFMADRNTPYAARALPPTNLGTYKDSPEANYHQYCVVKSFSVITGTIAKGFNQVGGAQQYYLENDSIQNHLNNGDLIEVAPT